MKIIVQHRTWIIIFFCFHVLGCNQNGSKETINSNHKLSGVIEGFHLYSYYAGSIFTAAEFVSAGCKKLALSAPYTEEEVAAMMEPIKMASEEYNVPFYVEKDFLTTILFSPLLTEGKTVLFIAQNQNVLDDYFELKKYKQKAMEEGRLAEVEKEIAWKFGNVLSYSEENILRVIAGNT